VTIQQQFTSVKNKVLARGGMFQVIVYPVQP
jgi:hypothetical protein